MSGFRPWVGNESQPKIVELQQFLIYSPTSQLSTAAELCEVILKYGMVPRKRNMSSRKH